MRVLDTTDVKDVQALAFSPDGRYLAAGTNRQGFVVHDLAGGGAARVGPDGFRWALRIGFEPGGAVVATTTDGRTRFDPATGGRLGVGPFDPDGPRPVPFFDSSAAGTRLATVQFWSPRSRLICWDAADDGWERRWFVDDRPAYCPPAVSPAGDRVAFFAAETLGAGAAQQLLVFDADSGEPVGAGTYPFAELHGPCYQPGGRQIVVPHAGVLVVWDARVLGKPARVKNDTRQHFTAAAFHPSGRYLFTTSNDATVTVWDTDEWVRVKRFAWEVGRLRSVAVSADGLLAAAGSDRGRVVVWDVDV
ncbi:WD40 repeat domain-containing protein [Urbifossiella limnaea]|uniref:WD domain, G-beta repeat n=1 Tax=Urbifossiella limnaea TaxID=2528023 RepID=A0A517XML9_9BACT|nr:WD40 repeat domain-containing protein [Urbifossiella limnaea]QDU18738.1 WD domain, G-beta repeat [Urbifossiella limnaea]